MNSMKAYVLHGVDELQYEEVANPQIQDTEVLVEVKAAGICGSDIPRIFRTGTYSFPTIPGHEFSGIVKQVGANVSGKWMGKRVGIFPLIPCRECAPCKRQQYEMCRHYSYLGSRTDGGFAELAVVPEWNLIALSDTVSFEAAAMLEPMAVAVHAIRQIKPKRDDTVVVLGLGTIGLLLTMFLKEMGIEKVLTMGNKEFQKKMVQKLGVLENQYCDSRLENTDHWISTHTDEPHQIDVCFECVGKNTTVNEALCLTSPGGKVQLVGNPESDMVLDKNTYWKILRNQLTIKGTWNSSFTHRKEDDWHYALEKIASRRIHPEEFITHKLAFDELEQGLHIMRNKTEEYGKVMIGR